MTTKKDFVTYMTHVYGPSNMYTDLYNTFKDIQNITDKATINKLHDLGYMVGKQRKLYYREVLANNGKELTPDQLDMYLTTIRVALDPKQMS